MRPEPLLSDPRIWDPRAALIAAQHAAAVYADAGTYGFQALEAGWTSGIVVSQGAAQAGVAWSPEVVLVSPRGSSQRADWLHDVSSLARVRWQTVLPVDVTIGWGFRRQALAICPVLLEWVQRLLTDFPDAKVVIGGHSLGGGLVPLVAAFLRHNGIPVFAAWSLESPRVGNQAWAAWYDAEMEPQTPTWRLVNTHDGTPDLVTRVPKRRWGFRHIGRGDRVVTLLPGSALFGEDAWRRHRDQHPVSHLQALRIITRLSRSVRAHGAELLVERLEHLVRLGAV